MALRYINRGLNPEIPVPEVFEKRILSRVQRLDACRERVLCEWVRNTPDRDLFLESLRLLAPTYAKASVINKFRLLQRLLTHYFAIFLFESDPHFAKASAETLLSNKKMPYSGSKVLPDRQAGIYNNF